MFGADLYAQLLKAATLDEDRSGWQRLRWDVETLRDAVSAYASTLPHKLVKNREKKREQVIGDLASNYEIAQLVDEDFEIKFKGLSRRFSRVQLAELAGGMGAYLLTSRLRAVRMAQHAATEALYLGNGNWEQLFIEDPLAVLGHTLQPAQKGRSAASSLPDSRGVLFRDLRPGFEHSLEIFDLLSRNPSVKSTIVRKDDFVDFQRSLRKAPFDGLLVTNLQSFFNKRATIGLRDGLRWLMGSRHPWFGWETARDHIKRAFARHRHADFHTPSIVYYAYDPQLSQEEIDFTTSFNDRVVGALAERIARKMRAKLREDVDLDFVKIARWTLDIHHDYADFYCESEGAKLAETHISFIGHNLHARVASQIDGRQRATRRNFQIYAHFEANHLTGILLAGTSNIQKRALFSIINEELLAYDKRGGLQVGAQILSYRRLPCIVSEVTVSSLARPAKGEVVVDSFDLSQMKDLVHSAHIHRNHDIVEQLVVFYTLCLRLLYDTQHLPDLRPKNLVKDFFIFGLWGVHTQNIQIQIYKKMDISNESNDQNVDQNDQLSSGDSLNELRVHQPDYRCEIRFVGHEQIENFVLKDISQEWQLAGFIASHIGPMIEPSVLRLLSVFVMAMEERARGNHAQSLHPSATILYALDVVREVGRFAAHDALIYSANLNSVLIDAGVDLLQRQVDRVVGLFSKRKHYRERRDRTDDK